MDEFQLIKHYFQSIIHKRTDVVAGIGDDAACLQVDASLQLLVSCDTLVSGVHFLPTWRAYDIATKAVMVNLSDIAAMAGTPSWMTLSLTLPEIDECWVEDFALGLSHALSKYNVALIGGDTTRGPLSLTLTVHGFVRNGLAVYRSGARCGDIIYVSGPLGAAAKALRVLQNNETVSAEDYASLMRALHAPRPRFDLGDLLQQYATSAIDISDGLASDLNHICQASNLGACISAEQIPVNSLLNSSDHVDNLALALHGGDDYELCFTVPSKLEFEFNQELQKNNLQCYAIGVMDEQLGLRLRNIDGLISPLIANGYNHFRNKCVN